MALRIAPMCSKPHYVHEGALAEVEARQNFYFMYFCTYISCPKAHIALKMIDSGFPKRCRNKTDSHYFSCTLYI